MKECARWTPEEHEVIAKEYATADLDLLAKKLGRTVAAVRRYAQTHQIKRPRLSTKGYRYTLRNPRPRKVVEKPHMAVEAVLRGWL